MFHIIRVSLITVLYTLIAAITLYLTLRRGGGGGADHRRISDEADSRAQVMLGGRNLHEKYFDEIMKDPSLAASLLPVLQTQNPKLDVDSPSSPKEYEDADELRTLTDEQYVAYITDMISKSHVEAAKGTNSSIKDVLSPLPTTSNTISSNTPEESSPFIDTTSTSTSSTSITKANPTIVTTTTQKVLPAIESPQTEIQATTTEIGSKSSTLIASLASDSTTGAVGVEESKSSTTTESKVQPEEALIHDTDINLTLPPFNPRRNFSRAFELDSESTSVNDLKTSGEKPLINNNVATTNTYNSSPVVTPDSSPGNTTNEDVPTFYVADQDEEGKEPKAVNTSSLIKGQGSGVGRSYNGVQWENNIDPRSASISPDPEENLVLADEEIPLIIPTTTTAATNEEIHRVENRTETASAPSPSPSVVMDTFGMEKNIEPTATTATAHKSGTGNEGGASSSETARKGKESSTLTIVEILAAGNLSEATTSTVSKTAATKTSVTAAPSTTTNQITSSTMIEEPTTNTTMVPTENATAVLAENSVLSTEKTTISAENLTTTSVEYSTIISAENSTANLAENSTTITMENTTVLSTESATIPRTTTVAAENTTITPDLTTNTTTKPVENEPRVTSSKTETLEATPSKSTENSTIEAAPSTTVTSAPSTSKAPSTTTAPTAVRVTTKSTTIINQTSTTPSRRNNGERNISRTTTARTRTTPPTKVDEILEAGNRSETATLRDTQWAGNMSETIKNTTLTDSKTATANCGKTQSAFNMMFLPLAAMAIKIYQLQRNWITI